MPSSVTSIRERAFSGCKSLYCLTVPDSVTQIGEGAFYGCRRFSVSLPYSVQLDAKRFFEKKPKWRFW